MIFPWFISVRYSFILLSHLWIPIIILLSDIHIYSIIILLNILILFCMHACILSQFSCVQVFVTPWTVARQAPLSMEFSRQEYWSGLSFPSPGDLPDPGIKPGSPALQADYLPTELWGKGLGLKYFYLLVIWSLFQLFNCAVVCCKSSHEYING